MKLTQDIEMKIYKYALLLAFVLSSSLVFSADKKSQLIKSSNEELHIIKSKSLQRDVEFIVRLPASYAETKRAFPVIYLLNASSFYSGDIGLDSSHKIEQLQKQHSIPESIVVLVNSDQWYADVINNADKFEKYLNQDLADFVNQKYRTLNNSILIGHSYAGAFVSRLVASEINQFNFLLALSPIYPNVDYVKEIQTNIQSMKPSNSTLHIIQGDEDYAFVSMLDDSLKNTSKNKFNILLDKIKYEGHFSIVSIGLSFGLRNHFSDFRIPRDSYVLKNRFDYKEIKDYFIKRDKKYQLQVTEDELNNAITSSAKTYLSAKKFKLAFPLWQRSQSRFRGYFMNTIAEQLLAAGDSDSAIIIWKEMTQLLADKSGSYAGLAKGYMSINNISKAILNYTKAVELAKKNKHSKLDLYQSKLNTLLNK